LAPLRQNGALGAEIDDLIDLGRPAGPQRNAGKARALPTP
jgi:hypothetical protein